ncbi:uncharacterized protein CLUP02_13943 [Colletotrichum lupini]|uniref:Uncharacterized protein n=1 Tax=Colletotrichum lupini TaxID=145971 RepID=A0A9Q8WM47_9PEZI|nr:uncharacterized protein CLUP02_13943 [Colletotrichum lupini]UQC88419.1 hypothetical protein CLUP02_13943 [Colletotrichum lupini]
MRVFCDCDAGSIFNDRHHEHESKKPFAAVPAVAATSLMAICWDRTKAKKNFPHTRGKHCFTHLRIPRCWCIRTDPRRSVLDSGRDGGPGWIMKWDTYGTRGHRDFEAAIGLSHHVRPSHGFLIKLASRHTSRTQTQWDGMDHRRGRVSTVHRCSCPLEASVGLRWLSLGLVAEGCGSQVWREFGVALVALSLCPPSQTVFVWGMSHTLEPQQAQPRVLPRQRRGMIGMLLTSLDALPDPSAAAPRRLASHGLHLRSTFSRSLARPDNVGHGWGEPYCVGGHAAWRGAGPWRFLAALNRTDRVCSVPDRNPGLPCSIESRFSQIRRLVAFDSGCSSTMKRRSPPRLAMAKHWQAFWHPVRRRANLMVHGWALTWANS